MLAPLARRGGQVTRTPTLAGGVRVAALRGRNRNALEKRNDGTGQGNEARATSQDTRAEEGSYAVCRSTVEAVLAKLGQGTPLKELLRWWDRASEEERGAFLKEITTQTRRPRLLKESPSQAGDHDALPAKDHLR